MTTTPQYPPLIPVEEYFRPTIRPTTGQIVNAPLEKDPLETRKAAYRLMAMHPGHFAEMVGLDRLNTVLHNGWMMDMLLTRDDRTLLAHRGSFKTSCVAIVIVCIMMTRPHKNIIFLRKTDDDVVEMLRLIRKILDHEVTRKAAQMIHGEPLRILRCDQHSLTTNVYRTMRGAPQLQCMGIGGSITGKHADYIFTDDIVNLQDRLSEAERRFTRQVYQELQAVRNPGGVILNTGTPWHPNDAVSVMPNKTVWPWNKTMLLSHRQIDYLRSQMEPALFAANYELRHVTDDLALIRTPPVYFTDITRLRGSIVHIDAAYGGSDFTAVTLMRRRGDKYLAYGKLWRAPFTDVLPRIAAIAKSLHCGPVYVETNGDKGWAAKELREAGLSVRTYHESAPKRVKIAGHILKHWPQIEFFSSTDEGYMDQLASYGAGATHDDAPDSLASALRVCNQRRFWRG